MNHFRVARCDRRAEPLHAATPGDQVSVCGHDLDQIFAEDWEQAPSDVCCPRCRQAIEVLRLIRAV